ncbi:MAG: preprotein translocase subunit SecY [Thermomicrobiales bacterium]|nr:preprotein translocase subunit SecY [Thermomicrobiales bacterium]MCO5218772.1 preprotein translocase subunit SecY [Thermomicrobiales bacterium]MCO5226009.1 preprotein translocase subunit SecY [Thermomicrobiales bacterium]MCO5229122.1 preprotein translocase subunit SecY [Thermomicrobiales bacterium]
MLQAVINAFKIPEIRRKILYTFAMLVIFRLIASVPVPGVDREGVRSYIETNQLLGMLNLFSGGGLNNFSIVALGVYPYITATIIMQLMTPIIPRLNELSQEGQQGRNVIDRYTHYITIPLALLQGYGQMLLFASDSGGNLIENFGLFDRETFLPTVAILFTLTAGTMLLVWIGELITENGIGNGVSVIIFGGIVASLPGAVYGLLTGNDLRTNFFGTFAFAIIGLITIVGVVLINEGQRRIPVHHAKRIRGNRQYGGTNTHIPLKVNSAGMIPLIFAVSIMVFPGMVANFLSGSNLDWVRNIAVSMSNWLSPDTIPYNIVYFFMVIGFTFFYTIVVFQQQRIPESLQRQGAFIPGIRPGRNTAVYLQKVLTRITFVGALFLGIIAILPFIASRITGVDSLLLSATSLLIVVGVAIDTMRQLESQLMMRNYEGFID